VDLIGQLLTPEPLADLESPAPWVARPAPSTARLALDDLARLAGAPLGLARRLPGMLSQARKPGSDVRAALRGLTDLALKSLRRPSETPFNKPIGTHRRFDWLVTGLDEVQAVRTALGGTVNDVVLATVAGAVRRFLSHRGVSPDGLQFRVMAPVNVRTAGGHGELGNQVAAWMVELPVADPDPRRRLETLQQTTLRLKEEKSALGMYWFTEMTGWAPASLLSLGARLSQRNLPFNMVVTNVPGPPRPLYFLSARMLDYYGLVPLTDYLGLGIVVFSYAGKLNWGFNADWDLVPDVDVFTSCVDAAFRELCGLAR
jgi:diacylglycerol O-acyltransferase / wax synthase